MLGGCILGIVLRLLFRYAWYPDAIISNVILSLYSSSECSCCSVLRWAFFVETGGNCVGDLVNIRFENKT